MTRSSVAAMDHHVDAQVDSPASWLASLRVLSVAETTATKVASGILEAFGAEVTRDDELSANTDDFDLVLVDQIQDGLTVRGDVSSVPGYLKYVKDTNKGVWVTASAFGLQTERAAARGSDFVALAAGGVLGHSRVGLGTPTVPAGEIALKLVGVMIAMSALHGVHLFKETGTPVHIDLSAQGSVVASGLCLELAHALGHCPDEGGSSRYGAPTGFFRCAQGQIYLVVLEQHQWVALQRTLYPALDHLPSIEDGRRFPAIVNRALEEWASTRSNLECERILQAAGVPCTAMNSVTQYLDRAAEVGRPIDRTTGASMPAQVETTVQNTSITGGLPLHQLRVLDAGHVLAVPLATAWLGAMGAQVTKLEDGSRLDVYRRRGPFVGGVPGLNRSAYFTQVNYCKSSLDVVVDDSGSTLDIEPFDVIMQNLSPRRARAVGVDAVSIQSAGRPRLSLSSSGFGGVGAWAGYRAYGHNIHAFAGLVNATQDSSGRMDDVGTPWADPLIGAVAATWVLAWSLADEHRAVSSVDLSMAEVMASQLLDLADVDPEQYYLNPDSGNDFFVRWHGNEDLVAVSLGKHEDVVEFERAIQSALPKGLRRGGETSAVTLGLPSTLSARDFAALLRDRGIAASFVENARSLASDSFLRSTGIIQRVQSATLGTYEVTGLPWSVIGQRRQELRSAPERS